MKLILKEIDPDGNERLLDNQLAAGVPTEKESIRIDVTESLLKFAKVSWRDPLPHLQQGFDPKIESQFDELFYDIGFFLRQAISGFDSGKNPKQDFVEKKLFTLLELMESQLDQFGDLLEKHLVTDNQKETQTAVFILSSVNRSDKNSPWLRRVLSEFETCNPEKRNGFIHGLKFGQHPAIRFEVLTRSLKGDTAFREACNLVLDYKDSPSTKLENRS